MYPIFVNKGDFMTITLLDLYNTAATQEWSMYDNDAASKEEFEKSLVLSLNKAVSEILYSLFVVSFTFSIFEIYGL